MASETKKWVQKSDLKEGSFTNQAKEHGMTAQQFANYVIKNPDDFRSKTLKRANLAKTFSKMSK